MSEPPADSAHQPLYSADDAAAFPSLAELAQLMPQYEMHEIIGIGGMGAVYKARQIALDRWAAIKVLPAVAAQNPEDVQRFIKEARAMAKLVHPHIVAVFDFGQTYAHHLFLVMEYVEGSDLHRRTRSGEITKERAREVIAQLCDALQFAHDRGVAHRDIKPANILITEDWKVKVADFGLARDLSAQPHPDEVEYGTPDYTAPERLIIGAKVDHRADIYALGVVIHEMLTGKTPTAAGKDAGKGLPEGFTAVISKCLMSDPDQRYQKASEVKVALLTATAENRGAAAETPGTKHSTKHGAPPPPHPGSLEGYSTYRPSPFARISRFLGPVGWAGACAALVAVFGFILFKDKVTIESAATTPDPAKVTQTTPAVEPPKIEPEPEKAPEPAPAPAPAPMATVPEAAPPTMATTKPTLPEPAPATPAPDGYSVPDGDAGQVMRLIGHTSSVYSLHLLNDQRRVVSASNDRTLRVWDLVDKKYGLNVDAGIDQIGKMQVTPDEKQALIYGFRAKKGAIVDLASGNIVHSLQFPHEKLVSMVYVPASQTVVAGGANDDERNNLFVWKLGVDDKFNAIADYKGRVYGMALMPGQDEVLVSASLITDPAKKSVRPIYARYNPAAGTLVDPEAKGLAYVTRVYGTPGASKVVAGGSSMKVFTLPDLQVLLSLPASPREGPFLTSGVLVDGDRLALTGWSDSTLRAYEIPSGAEVWRQDTPEPVTDIALSKDQRWAVFSTRYKDPKQQDQGSFDLLVWRLPKWYTLQSDQSLQAIVDAQMADLAKHDADLAGLRDRLREHSPLPLQSVLETDRQKLDAQYTNALRQNYPRVSPTEQQAFKLEFDLIAQKNPLPPQGVDAALPPTLQKLRGIYRQQLATLQNSYEEAAKIAREAVGKALQPLQDQRAAAGDRLGVMRIKNVLREWSGETSAAPAKTTSGTTPQPSSSAPGSQGSTPTRRSDRTGTVLAVQRAQANASINVYQDKMGQVPKDLGPVVAIAGGSDHVYALLPDGSLRGWGEGTLAVPADVADVVQIDSSNTSTIVLMSSGKVVAWRPDTESTPSTWAPTDGKTPLRVHAGLGGAGYIVLTDGSFLPLGTINESPPADLGAIRQLVLIPDRGWCALRERDGTPVFWGQSAPPVLPLPGDLRDLLCLSIGTGFGVALQRDGTMTGWGQTAPDQRYRLRKFTAATKVYHDYADRLFPVHRSDHSWELAANPNIPEYSSEDHVSVLEGRLRGAVDAVFGKNFVVALRQ